MSKELEPVILGTVFSGIAGGIAGAEISAARGQEKLDIATIQANREEAKLAASEKALQNATSFRRNLASQLALANFRGGPGSSIASQFGSASIANFFQDQAAIERGSKNIDTAARLATAQAKVSGKAKRAGTLFNFGQSALGSMNLSGGGSSMGGQ